MKKSKAELRKIALKAVATRRENERKKMLSERALKAHRTRRLNAKVSANKTTGYESKSKKSVKEIITELLLSVTSPKIGIIPTLAFLFSFEKKLTKIAELSGLTFMSFESARPVVQGQHETELLVKRQRRIIKKTSSLKSRVFHQENDINDWLLFVKQPNSFPHIFTDYCGNLIGKTRRAVIHILKNDLVQVNGIVWFTFANRGMSAQNAFLELFGKYAGKRYKIELLENYAGSKSGLGSPMTTVILRRIK